MVFVLLLVLVLDEYSMSTCLMFELEGGYAERDFAGLHFNCLHMTLPTLFLKQKGRSTGP